MVPKFWDIRDTLCEGLSYEQDGNIYTETGVYVDTLLSSIGCDSIVTLDLTFLPDAGIEAMVNKLDPACHYSSDGLISVRVTGTATNANPFPVVEPNVSAVLLDEYGQIVSLGYTIVGAEGIAPGASVPFDIRVKHRPYTNYQIYAQAQRERE